MDFEDVAWRVFFKCFSKAWWFKGWCFKRVVVLKGSVKKGWVF